MLCHTFSMVQKWNNLITKAVVAMYLNGKLYDSGNQYVTCLYFEADIRADST